VHDKEGVKILKYSHAVKEKIITLKWVRSGREVADQGDSLTLGMGSAYGYDRWCMG
jgi:hypothetical protein